MSELRIDSQVVAGVQTIYLQGEFDSYSAPRVRALLETLACQKEPSIRVHLGGLEYIDSVGLGVLVSGLKMATDRNGELCLVAPTPTIQRTLRITGLDLLFPIVTDSSDAPVTEISDDLAA